MSGLFGGSSQPQQQQPTSTTVTNTNLPAWAQPYSEKILGQASALTDINQNPYQQYGGQRVADFTPMQQQAFNTIGGMQVSPQNQQATNLAGAAGLGSLGAGQNYNRMATDPGAMQAFMSPYQQNVTDYQKQQAVMDYGRQLPGMGAAASNKGAFGGSRQAIVEGEGQRNLQNQLAGIQATGSQNAFQNAQQAMQFGTSAGLQGYNQALQGASTLGQLGQNQYAQQMGINAAQQQAGAQQQAFNQQGLSNQYQDFLNRQNYPYQQLGFMSDILHGTPTGGVTTKQESQVAPSMFSQIAGSLGGLGSLAGAYNAYGKAEGGEIKSYAKGGGVGSLPDISASNQVAVNATQKELQSGQAPADPSLTPQLKGLLALFARVKQQQPSDAQSANPESVLADLTKAVQGQQPQEPPQQMAQAPQQGMPPQGMPPQQPQGPTMMGAEGGLASLPVHNFNPDNYAGGGIIAFGEPDGDQQVPKPQGAEVPYSQAGRWLGGIADTITQSGSNFANWNAKQKQQHDIESEINKLNTNVFESISDKERDERLQKQKVLQTRIANLLDDKTKDSPPIAEAVKKENAPVSVRNNNPGNIVDPKTGKFRVFQTPEEGDAALERDLAGKLNGTSPAYKSRFGDAPVTPSTLAETWSPASATGNSKEATDNYAKFIAAKLGVDVNMPIPNTPEAMKAVKQAITAFESGAYKGKNKTATSVPLPPVVTLPPVPGIPGALPRDATNTRPYPEDSRYASASPLAPFANQDAAQAAADAQANEGNIRTPALEAAAQRAAAASTPAAPNAAAPNAAQKVTPAPTAYAGIGMSPEQVKQLMDEAVNPVKLTPQQRADRMAQIAEDRKAYGIDDEKSDKLKLKELTTQATEAKKSRDVGLWMSAAQGFFAMASQTGPGAQNALVNFAKGAGVSAKEAEKVLDIYRKSESDLSKAKIGMEEARQNRNEKAYDRFKTENDRLEMSRERAINTLLTHDTQAKTIHATREYTAEMARTRNAETKRHNEALEEDRRNKREAERKTASDTAFKNSPGYKALQQSIQTLDNRAQAKNADPNIIHAERVRLQNLENALRRKFDKEHNVGGNAVGNGVLQPGTGGVFDYVGPTGG